MNWITLEVYRERPDESTERCFTGLDPVLELEVKKSYSPFRARYREETSSVTSICAFFSVLHYVLLFLSDVRRRQPHLLREETLVKVGKMSHAMPSASLLGMKRAYDEIRADTNTAAQRRTPARNRSTTVRYPHDGFYLLVPLRTRPGRFNLPAELVLKAGPWRKLPVVLSTSTSISDGSGAIHSLLLNEIFQT